MDDTFFDGELSSLSAKASWIAAQLVYLEVRSSRGSSSQQEIETDGADPGPSRDGKELQHLKESMRLEFDVPSACSYCVLLKFLHLADKCNFAFWRGSPGLGPAQCCESVLTRCLKVEIWIKRSLFQGLPYYLYREAPLLSYFPDSESKFEACCIGDLASH